MLQSLDFDNHHFLLHMVKCLRQQSTNLGTDSGSLHPRYRSTWWWINPKAPFLQRISRIGVNRLILSVTLSILQWKMGEQGSQCSEITHLLIEDGRTRDTLLPTIHQMRSSTTLIPLRRVLVEEVEILNIDRLPKPAMVHRHQISKLMEWSYDLMNGNINKVCLPIDQLERNSHVQITSRTYELSRESHELGSPIPIFETIPKSKRLVGLTCGRCT